MSVDVKAASENVKQALGIGTIEDTLAGDQLRRAVAAEGRRVLLDARMLRRALEQEGAVERNIQLFCLMSGAPGLSELLEERSGATQADLDRFIRNAVEYTGLSRGTVLLKTYQICRAADLPMAYNPKDSRSVFMKGATVAYAFPPELYESALAPFRGEIEQIPPMYSAVKRGGKKLYELARKGVEVERAARPVTIYELELLSQESETDYLLRCRCSKGTYLRTLCHDLGAALGCGGTLYSLRRTMAAGFPLSAAVTLEEVQEQGEALLLPTDSLFSQYPALTVPGPQAERRVRCGNPITLPGTADGTYRVYGQDGAFLCLSRARGGTLTSLKNFFGA